MPYLIGEVVLFKSKLLPVAALGVDVRCVLTVLLQLQAHLLQLVLVTPQLILLSQPGSKQPVRCKWAQIQYKNLSNAAETSYLQVFLLPLKDF